MGVWFKLRDDMKKIVLLFVSMLLAGCFNFAGPSAPQKKYLFDVHYPKATKKQLTSDTLEVESAGALQQFSSREFVYRISNTQYITDYYHIFMISAARQITDITAKYLQGKGIFKQISTSKILTDNPDYTLRTKIMALYADYRNSSHPLAVVKIRYALIDNLKTKHPVLIDKTFSAKIPLQTKSTDALVKAWDQGLQNIMRIFSRHLYSIMRN